jgi:hypothetical protein
MTAAGIAFIAGGIATLICLRSVLFGGKDKQPEPPVRRQRSSRVEPPAEVVQLRAAAPAAALEPPPAPPAPRVHREPSRPRTDARARRAKVERPETPRQYRRHASYEPEPDPVVPVGEEESRPIPVRRVDRSDRAYGDRVDGWVRPEYHDDPEPPAGEYWTPVPMDDLDLPEADPEPSARGYGWPIPVERLPPVPDYEPATGFDLTPIGTEPTELVPTWPPMPADRPGRINLPRSWATRDAKPPGNRFLENEPRRARPDDVDERFRPPAGEPGRRRPRPRPRPAVTNESAYVSRHAADPPH